MRYFFELVDAGKYDYELILGVVLLTLVVMFVHERTKRKN